MSALLISLRRPDRPLAWGKGLRLTLALGSALALSACATFTPPKGQVALAPTFAQANSAVAVDNSQTRWWLAFSDERLNRLIARGLEQNLTVLEAIERLQEVGAGVTTEQAGALPKVTGSLNNTLSGGEGDVVQASTVAGLNASWLLDLFGQHRLSRQAALANLDRAYFSVEAARMTFLSGLTNAYITMRYNQEALALTRSGIQTRKETLALTEAMLAEGAGSRLDVLQARGALDSATVELATLELGFIESLHRLATLTAQPAANLRADLEKGAPQPWPRLRTNAGIPADLVRQRPDLRAAERALAAAYLEAGAAEAALYPSITLSGDIQLGVTNSWTFGPVLNLPIFDGGRARANVQVALSRAEQAYLRWKGEVLGAVEETENALAAVRRSGQTVETLRGVETNAAEALRLATENYRAGGSRILEVLDAQRVLLDARLRLASATRDLAKNYVALNVALGGGAATLTAR